MEMPPESTRSQASLSEEEKYKLLVEDLEIRLAERTAELKQINKRLNLEMEQRIRAEEALRENEERFRLVADFTCDWEYWIGLDGKILYNSPSCLDITGIPAQEFMNDSSLLIQIIHPEDRARFEQHLKEDLNSQAACAFDFRIVSPGGKERWIGHACQPVFSLDGRPLGRRASNRDISEMKLAEQTLRHQVVLLNYLTDAVIASDQDYHITIWNPEAEHMYGWKAGEVLGRNGLEILKTQFPDADKSKILKMINEKGYYRGEATQLRKDGNRFPVDLSSVVLRDNKGQITGYLSVNRDITERIKTEEELRRYADEISDLYNNAPCGYFSTREDHTFVRINDTLLKMLGYSRDELVGKKKFFEIFHPEDQARAREIILILDREGMINNLESDLVRKDGSRLPVLINISTIKNADGQIVMSRVTLFDNTEMKRAQKIMRQSMETAESANRAKSIFLANMSHEIRTPMNAILGFAQIMQRGPALTADQARHLEIISRNGEQLLELINDILEMSKIEADRITLNPNTFNLREMMRHVESMFRERTDAKRLRIHVEIAKDLPDFVIADESKLRQIFINLLGNAVKFTQSGWILWRTHVSESNKDKVILVSEIEDTGQGIAADEMEKLFKPFGQTSSGILHGGGSGLGLAISQKIAQLMKGEIRVKSEEGKGSIFEVKVEVERGEGKNINPDTPYKNIIGVDPTEEKRRILVVDDLEENRLLLVEILEKVGFQTKQGAGGKDAVLLNEQWKPHLIFMDMRMPDLDGFETIRQIKSSAYGRDIPIIAVTASAFAEDHKRALNAGADGFIRKPYKEQELFAAIKNCLGTKYIYRENDSAQTMTPSEDTPQVPAVSLAQLPHALVTQIHYAAASASLDQLLALIDQIAAYSPQAANILRNLAQSYQYEKILSIVEGHHVIS